MERLKKMRAARRAQQTRLVKEISDLIETNEFNLSTLRTILQRLEKSTNELAKINGELHAEMSDDEVAADYDSVLEYEDQAAGALGLLRHHILELSNPPTTGTGVRVEPPPIQPTSALPSGENGPQVNDDRNLRPTAEEDLEDLLQYFRVEVDCRERTAHGPLEGSSRQYLLPGSGRRQTRASSAAVLKNSATETCVFCEKSHATSECDSSLDHNEKRRLLTASGSCFRCTTKGHRAQDCRRKDDGLLRIRIRLQNAVIQPSVKNPRLLPGDHRVTQLNAHSAHTCLFHAGIPVAVAEIRERFWIVAARQCVKKARSA
ncbi:hypothetical protein HPB49_012375 [Dermacentor silvarum]|uniref:Uncharacterized protein n=1 Tax=Dermacentor silvarum TaxID=543639 RepID=A0ACB8DD94_DERSI|nr:hypothetical protein HPB49_012375 [Dermacentor silvarum]